jgi:hypothetical protein
MVEQKEEEVYPPHATNTEVAIEVGSSQAPVKFRFSTARPRFSDHLNRVMSQLPTLLDRLTSGIAEASSGLLNVILVVANYSMTDIDDVILCDTSGGPFNVSLVTSSLRGKKIVIAKTDSSGNAVGIIPFGDNTIEGASSKSLTSQHQKVILVSDGSVTWIDESTGGV